MRWLGIAWNIAAFWFLLSVIAAPFFLVIRKARARGKRLFVEEPLGRVRALKHDHTNTHIYDA